MTPPEQPAMSPADRKFVYAAVIIGSLAISLDFASVDLALPAMEGRFGLDLESVQWVINGYILAFSVLMVGGGRMADAYGRRRVFLIGMAIFAFASLLGGAAWSGGSVIAFRVLQGVGAALLWPAMIGMACAALGNDKQELALGLIMGTCSLGNAAGPLAGGALTEYLSWRWVLWVNVPMALFAVLVTVWKVPKEAIGGKPAKNDYLGMALLTGGLVAMMLFVYQGQTWGWTDPRTLGLGATALALLVAFPPYERRIAEPLVPPDVMRNKEILTLCLCVIVICQLFFIVLLYFTQYAMKFLGDNPVAAGAKVVPFMLSYGAVSYFGAPFVKALGTRLLLIVGLCAAIVASVFLGAFGPGANWILLNGSLILLGIGVGAVIPTVSARAIETAGAERASLMSGIVFMCQLSGAALMLAVNTALFAFVSVGSVQRLLAKANIPVDASEHAAITDILSGAGTIHELPRHLPGEVDDAAGMIAIAYGDGLQVVLWFSAALVAIALVFMLRYVPRRVPGPPRG